MIKIYGSNQSSAARVYWMCKEANIPYEYVSVDFAAAQHKSPDFLKLNPNGKIPAVVDGDYVIWESSAINVYLASKYAPAMLGETPEEMGHIAQWSFWNHTELYSTISPLITQKWRGTPDDDSTAKAKTDYPMRLAILNEALEGKDYLVANRFTVVDINLASNISVLPWIEISLENYPNIQRWMTSLEARPGYQQSKG